MAIEFLTVNLIDIATLTHSSEEASLPAENIQSSFRTKKWRSDSGFNIVAGVNDKIDIDESTTGLAAATLTPGNYATGALMAAHAHTQIDLVATDCDWNCTYHPGTRKFTISHDSGGNGETGDLLWNTGPNAATSAGEDLGFDTSADDTGLATYPGDDPCRCSREWIGIALDAATQAKRCAIVSHNFSSSAVVTLYRHNADDLSAATAVGAITYDADFMIIEFDATFKFWWIRVDDIDHSDAYIEMGRPFLGDYDTLTQGAAQGMILAKQDPSVPISTPEGVVGKNIRTSFYTVAFALKPILNTDRDTLLTVYDRVGAFTHFFLRLDPAETIFVQAALGGLYGYFTNDRMDLEAITKAVWGTTLNFEEAR